MKTASRWSVLLCLSAPLALCACASLGIIKGEGERIRAEGAAPYNPADPEGTRRAAIVAAQRNAVEQALGVFVSAQARVRKAELIDSKIVAASAGFIKQYSIDGEKRDGDVYRVAIKAVVLLDRMDRELSGLGLEESQPLASIAVISREESAGVQLEGRDAARSLEQALAKRGFRILQAEPVAGLSQAVSSARSAGADYLAYVEARAYKIDNGGALGDGFFPYRARVSVKLVSVGDGASVADAAKESGGLDVTEQIAARKALSAAADLAAKDVVPGLELAAKSRIKGAEVHIYGLAGLNQLRDFRAAVSGLAEVEECRLKSYESGDAVFSLRLESGAGDELAAAIIRATPFRLMLQSVNPYELRLRAN